MEDRKTKFVTRLREKGALRIGEVIIHYSQRSAGQIRLTVEAPISTPITHETGHDRKNIVHNPQDVLGKP